MLEQNDLELIRSIMKEEINTRAKKTENLLLDEIGRTQVYLDAKIDEVKKNLEELEKYYRITRLEQDNTTLLLKMVTQLQDRVSELEKKTA